MINKIALLSTKNKLDRIGLVETSYFNGHFSKTPSVYTDIKEGLSSQVEVLSGEGEVSEITGLSLASAYKNMIMWNVSLLDTQRDDGSILPNMVSFINIDSKGEWCIEEIQKTEIESKLLSPEFIQDNLEKLSFNSLETLIQQILSYSFFNMDIAFSELSGISSLSKLRAYYDEMIKKLKQELSRSIDSPEKIKSIGFNNIEQELRNVIENEKDVLSIHNINQDWADRINHNLTLHADILSKFFTSESILSLAQSPNFIIDLSLDKRFERHVDVDNTAKEILARQDYGDFFSKDTFLAAYAYRNYSKIIMQSLKNVGHNNVKADLIGSLGVGDYFRLDNIKEEYVRHLSQCLNDAMGMIELKKHYGADSPAFIEFYTQWVNHRNYEAISISQNASENTSSFLSGIQKSILNGSISTQEDVVRALEKYSSPQRFIKFMRDDILAASLFHANNNEDSEVHQFYNLLKATGLYNLIPKPETIQVLKNKINTALDSFNMDADVRNEINKAVTPIIDEVDSSIKKKPKSNSIDALRYTLKSYGIDITQHHQEKQSKNKKPPNQSVNANVQKFKQNLRRKKLQEKNQLELAN